MNIRYRVDLAENDEVSVPRLAYHRLAYLPADDSALARHAAEAQSFPKRRLDPLSLFGRDFIQIRQYGCWRHIRLRIAAGMHNRPCWHQQG